AVHNRQRGLNAFYFFVRHGQVIRREGGHIRELPDGDSSFLAALTREPTAALSVEPQGFLPAQAVCPGTERSAPERVAANQPVEGQPGIVAGHARGVRPRSHRNAQFEHFANGWSPFGGLPAVSIEKVFALESHAVLNGD